MKTDLEYSPKPNKLYLPEDETVREVILLIGEVIKQEQIFGKHRELSKAEVYLQELAMLIQENKSESK